MNAVNKQAEKKHQAKIELIRKAKEIFDSRFEKKEEDRVTELEALNLAMIDKNNLDDGKLYHGYSSKTTEAYWSKKGMHFITNIQGYKTSLKYFEEFIPMVSDEDLAPEKEYTLEELKDQLQVELKELDKVKKQAKAIGLMLNEHSARVSNARNLFERKLIGDKNGESKEN